MPRIQGKEETWDALLAAPPDVRNPELSAAAAEAPIHVASGDNPVPGAAGVPVAPAAPTTGALPPPAFTAPATLTPGKAPGATAFKIVFIAFFAVFILVAVFLVVSFLAFSG